MFWCFDSFLITKAIRDWGDFFGIHGKAMKSCPDRICYHPDSASGHTIGGRWDVWHRTFHLDVSHPEFCFADIPPGCLTSENLIRRHSIRIFCIQCLTPDGRGGRFNFPGQTYLNPLIALIRRVSQIFCTVSRCSPEASRYLRPTFWDILL